MDEKTKKQNAIKFAEEYKNKGYEKGETQTFWYKLLRDVIDYKNISSTCKPEYRLSNGGFIDYYIPDSGVIIEQKSLGTNLDKPEMRQGEIVTPYQQALKYTYSLRSSQKPQYIIVCNFETFRIHDLDKETEKQREYDYIEFKLHELPDKYYLLNFITDPQNSRLHKENEISKKAGDKIAEFYKKLSKQFINPDSDESQHALNVLCVRLVFCLFCEDANGLFPKYAFLNYLKNTEPDNIRMSLKRLFMALNTPLENRDPYDEKIKPFPYVNGGLFEEDTEIPNFTADLKHYLLFELSQQINWSHISPTIFGAIFESTLNPETRETGGMHYTSLENIHKVIDPLFLDELRNNYQNIILDQSLTNTKKIHRLKDLHKKICSLAIFDPACGSGNFLTETYICLRDLENDILAEINAGQTQLIVDDENSNPNQNLHVSLNQFYGIEINDWAVRVANVAMWIAQLQSNEKTEMTFSTNIADFPLNDQANIICANALQENWNEILPASKCSYIIGNPPFYGARNQSKEQKADIIKVFDGARNAGNIDYVAGWYMKAAKYIENYDIKCAYVSTNSICQGEQVANVWKPIFDLGIHIDFAHNTFRWKNDAKDEAHVFCIVIGFSKFNTNNKIIFHHKNPDSDDKMIKVKNINAYLKEAPNEFIWNRNNPICNTNKLGIGSQPIDNGNFLFTKTEMEEFIKKEPASKKFFHPWIGSHEFIHNYYRYVLWLGNIQPEELIKLPECQKRVENVRLFREQSKRTQTKKAAKLPNHFGTEIIAKDYSIVIPEISSERRKYIPIGFISPEIFCSNRVKLIPNANLYYFGILTSLFHNAWTRTVCGRLKSDYTYSVGVVYNNFIWPYITKENIDKPVEEVVPQDIRSEIESSAQAILDARNNYPKNSLADMYDPKNEFMFPDLFKAHNNLDKAVEQAYGVNFKNDENKIVSHLFNLYNNITT